MRGLILLLALAGCVETQPGDCPVMTSELGRQLQAECQRAKLEAAAKAAGKPVTTCVQSGGTVTCVTE